MSEAQEYVIRRGGGFYRPGAQGYTQEISEAGRWSRAEAGLYAVNCEGVTVHHENEFPPDKVTVLTRAIRDALKIVGDPASGHKMMSSRREAQAVHRILSGAVALTNGEPK